MPKPALGSTVGGKYRILRALGEGGMGTVYEVEHVLTHKRAAIKRVHPQTGSSDSAHERLLHEARATSRIHHRNVVDVYDVLREDDAVCLVMQLLVGEPLSELIARGPMPLPAFVALLLPAMRGVAAAHGVGVIHRDIKPDNIFLSQEPGQPEIVPKVIDFGISKVFDPESSDRLTHSGITMGTPKYVSYEQLLGARDVDGRADVYAFGVMLYEAITGEPPYRAGTFGEQAVAFAMSVPARPLLYQPDLALELDSVVYRAVAKDREQRTASIEELICALEPFADPSAYRHSLLAFPPRQGRRGVAEHNDVTVPAVPTPISRKREERLEASRLPSAPPAPPPPSTGERGSARPRSLLLSLSVTLVAAAGLGMLAWWFKVPDRPMASLPAAHAAPREVVVAPAVVVISPAKAHDAESHASAVRSGSIDAMRELTSREPVVSAAATPAREQGATKVLVPIRAPVAARADKANGSHASAKSIPSSPGGEITRASSVKAVLVPETAALEPGVGSSVTAEGLVAPGVPVSVASDGSARGDALPAPPTYRAGPIARDEF